MADRRKRQGGRELRVDCAYEKHTISKVCVTVCLVSMLGILVALLHEVDDKRWYFAALSGAGCWMNMSLSRSVYVCVCVCVFVQMHGSEAGGAWAREDPSPSSSPSPRRY